MKLTLYMIRHGLSCCNIMHHKDLKMSAFNVFRKDPLLTHKGVDQSERAGQYIRPRIPPVDIVFCSALIRSIETAQLMFPDNIVHVCPYICEKRPSLENCPYSTSCQLARLHKHFKDPDSVKFPSSDTKGLSACNLKLFLDFILENYTLDDQAIAVVTHSNFMVDILNLDTRMNNNSVFKVVVDTDSGCVLEHSRVFSGYEFPHSASLHMGVR